MKKRSVVKGHEAAILGVVALIVLSIGFFSDAQPFVSSEVKFVDRSHSGVGIVPASCPSYPHYSGECSATPPDTSCTPQYYCSGNDLYYTNASCSNSLVQACAWGCSYGACLTPPQPVGNITANPAVVRSGNTSVIEWEASNVESCTVTENNPDINDSWVGTNGTRTSGGITQLTTYTLNCIDLSGGTFLDYAKVNVIPLWEEQ